MLINGPTTLQLTSSEEWNSFTIYTQTLSLSPAENAKTAVFEMPCNWSLREQMQWKARESTIASELEYVL